MASKFALVPWDDYKRLSSRRVGTSALPQEPDSQGIHIYGLEPQNNEDSLLMSVVDLLPRQLRSKGRLLLHYMAGKITLDDQSRIIYTVGDPGGSAHEEIGSHILDLVRFTVSPSSHFGNPDEPSANRPRDYDKFQSLIAQIGGIPSAAFGKGKNIPALGDAPQNTPPQRKRSAVRRPSRKVVRRRYY